LEKIQASDKDFIFQNQQKLTNNNIK